MGRPQEIFAKVLGRKCQSCLCKIVFYRIFSIMRSGFMLELAIFENCVIHLREIFERQIFSASPILPAPKLEV